MTLVSANIRFVPIFDGVHWREGVRRLWGNRKHGRYIFGSFGNQAKPIIHYGDRGKMARLRYFGL